MATWINLDFAGDVVVALRSRAPVSPFGRPLAALVACTGPNGPPPFWVSVSHRHATSSYGWRGATT